MNKRDSILIRRGGSCLLFRSFLSHLQSILLLEEDIANKTVSSIDLGCLEGLIERGLAKGDLTSSST